MHGIVGFIKLLLQNQPMPGWLLCDGALVAASDYPQLFAKVHYRFGGEGPLFALPTMLLPDGFAFVRVHETEGEVLDRLEGRMPNNMLSQVSPYAGEDEPAGWMECDGRLLGIRANYVLATLVGPRFGGDGLTTFALPTLPPNEGIRYMICVEGANPRETQGGGNDDD
jgi:microcystin-dependent protein